MERKLCIVANSYEPNTAPTNRLLSFIDEFEKSKINVELVFLHPNRKADKVIGAYQYVKVRYLWDYPMFRVKRISQIIRMLFGYPIKKIIRGNSKVFLFGAPFLVASLVRLCNIRVYHERTEHPSVIKLKFRWQQKAYLEACKRLDALFVISTALKTYFVNIGVPKEKIEIINMTVNVSRFQSIEKNVSLDKYLAYCGTVSNNKDGVDDLIRAFSLIHQKYPKIKLYIIGKIPILSEKQENLRLIENLGLKDAIVFTGEISANDMPQILKNAYALLLARPDSLQAKNGFPTKLGEYLLSGNPVICTKVGDISLFLEDRKSAFLVEPRDVIGFAEKIIYAIENEDLAKRVGFEGMQIAKQYFNSETETKKIIEKIFEEEK